jgi:hypothetical protein
VLFDAAVFDHSQVLSPIGGPQFCRLINPDAWAN